MEFEMMIRYRPIRRPFLPRWLAVPALMMLAWTAPAAAVPVTVNGTFTSFTSWMFDPVTDPTTFGSKVNGTDLSSSGVVVGRNGFINFYRSNPVTFAGSTTQVEFHYDWIAAGSPRSNALEWSANTYDFPTIPPGTAAPAPVFLLGTLSFTNGAWFPRAEVGLRLTTSSADSSLNGHVLNSLIDVANVDAGCSSPAAEADSISLRGARLPGGRVFDIVCQPLDNPGNIGRFAVWGYIGSLHLTDFVADSPAAFVDTPTGVPEPASSMLLAVGLVALGGARSRLLQRQKVRS